MVLNSKFINKHRRKTHIIPLAIDPEKYPTTALKSKLPPFALFVGRFIYYKGVLELITALKKTSITLVMIGEGPLESEIRKRGAELMNNNRLFIYPFQERNELNAYFNQCEFFVLPSTHPSEAFGIVQLEAMIYKKALISTNLPTGVPFVNQDQTTGRIVEPGNSSELADAMQTLWDNKPLCKTFGKNAYDRCMTYFTEDKMLEKTKKTFLSA